MLSRSHVRAIVFIIIFVTFPAPVYVIVGAGTMPILAWLIALPNILHAWQVGILLVVEIVAWLGVFYLLAAWTTAAFFRGNQMRLLLLGIVVGLVAVSFLPIYCAFTAYGTECKDLYSLSLGVLSP